jgi:hypothetical protein
MNYCAFSAAFGVSRDLRRRDDLNCCDELWDSNQQADINGLQQCNGKANFKKKTS